MKIEYDEKQNIEFKEIWRDEYLKWICGFANAQGGTLYIGVNDNAEVVGVENAKKMLEDIPNKVRDALGIMVDVNLIQVEEKNFLQNHGSRPYNPDIANAFFRAGEIESWGRGIEKICTALSQQNLNPPEYIQLGEAVCTTFRFVEPTTSETDIPAGSVEARKILPITAQEIGKLPNNCPITAQ